MLHITRKQIIYLVLWALAACNAAVPHCDENRASPDPLGSGDYDFIVAGGGTAGAIVAARLASANFHVLVIESGFRLYDDATLSAKFFTQLMTGSETIGSLIDSLTRLEGVASLRESDTGEGEEVGRNVETGVPGFMPHLQETPFMSLYTSLTEATHHYPTVPQIYSQKREIDYPRGNVLGGSSGANTMVYFRGSERDFNQWEQDFGLKGWGYRDVLPFFKKYENNQDVHDPAVHGFTGPINITIVQKHFASPPVDAWTNAALELGYPKIEDASNPTTVYGASNAWQSFVGADGKRSDTSAYIRLLDKKGKVCWNKPRAECGASQTLHVWTEKHVTKVLFQGKRAYGLEYGTGMSLDRTEHPKKSRETSESVKGHSPYNKWDRTEVQKGAERLGAPVAKELAFDWKRTADQYIPETKREFVAHTVTAKYEVILSAGAIASPQLLMLSGIGPAEHLRERGIDVLVDLPVGKHMNDHQEVVSIWKFPDNYDPGFSFISETAKGFPNLRAHLRGERSFFSSNSIPAGLEGSSAGPTGTIPKWHLHHIPVGPFENFDYNLAAYPETIAAPYRLPRSLVELYRWKGLKLHVHNCELSQNHAYGRLELRNTDPFVPPFVDPRYGSSDEDNAEMVNCLEVVREIMAKSDSKYVGEELEPTKSAKTKEQLTQYVRNAVWGHHISSSAPMGNCTVPYAVTDARGRVYGVEGLRVADISLFPTIPHGNPAGVVMMVGEKIADQILKDYKVSNTKIHDEL